MRELSFATSSPYWVSYPSASAAFSRLGSVRMVLSSVVSMARGRLSPESRANEGTTVSYPSAFTRSPGKTSITHLRSEVTIFFLDCGS